MNMDKLASDFLKHIGLTNEKTVTSQTLVTDEACVDESSFVAAPVPVSEEDLYSCSAPLPFSASVCTHPFTTGNVFEWAVDKFEKEFDAVDFRNRISLLAVDPQQIFALNFPEGLPQAVFKDLVADGVVSSDEFGKRLDAAWGVFQIDVLTEAISLWNTVLSLAAERTPKEAIEELMNIKVAGSSLFSPLAQDIPGDLNNKKIALNAASWAIDSGDMLIKYLEQDLKLKFPLPTQEQADKLKAFRASVLSRFIEVVDGAVNSKFNGDPFLKWKNVEFLIERLGLNYNGDMLLFKAVETAVVNLASQVSKDDPSLAVLFKLEFYSKTGSLDMAMIEKLEAEMGLPEASKKMFTGALDQAYALLTPDEFVPPIDESTGKPKEIDLASAKIAELASANPSFAVTWSRLWTERYLRELSGRSLDLERIAGLEKRFNFIIKRCRYARSESANWKVESEFYLRAIYTITAVWGAKNGPMLQRLVTCKDRIVNVDAVAARAKEMQNFAVEADLVVPSGGENSKHFREVVAAIYWLAYVESYFAGGLFLTAAGNVELLPDKVKGTQYYGEALKGLRERFGETVIDEQGKFLSGNVSSELKALAEDRTVTFFLSSKNLWRETMLPAVGAIIGSVGGPIGSMAGAGVGKFANQQGLKNDPGARRLINEAIATGLSLIPESEASARELENVINYGMVVGLSGLGAKLNYTILSGGSKLVLAVGRSALAAGRATPRFIDTFIKTITSMPANARLLFSRGGAWGGSKVLFSRSTSAVLDGVKSFGGKSWKVIATDRQKQIAPLLAKRLAKKGADGKLNIIDHLAVRFTENMAFAVHFRLLLGVTAAAVDYYFIPPRDSEIREGRERSFGLLGGFGFSLWINEFVGAMLMGFNGGGSLAATIGRFGLETAILSAQGFSISNMPLGYLMVAMGLSNVIRGTNKIYVEGVPQLQKARLYRGVLKFMQKNGIDDLAVPQSVIGRSASKVKAKWAMGRLRQFKIQGPGEESSLAVTSNRIMRETPPQGTCVGVSRYTHNQQMTHKVAFDSLMAGKTTSFPSDFAALGVDEQVVRRILGVGKSDALKFFAYKGSSPRFKASLKGSGNWFIFKRDNGRLVLERATGAPKHPAPFPEKSASFAYDKSEVQQLLSPGKRQGEIVYSPVDVPNNRLAVSVDGRAGEVYIIKLKIDHTTKGLGGPIVVEKVTAEGFKKMGGFTREAVAGKVLRQENGVDFVRAGYYHDRLELGGRPVTVIKMEAKNINPSNSYYAADGRLVFVDVGPNRVRGDVSSGWGRMMKKWDETMQKTVHATYADNPVHKFFNRFFSRNVHLKKIWDKVGSPSTADGKYIPTTMGVVANWEDLYFIYLVKSLGAPLQGADPHAVGSVEVVNYAIAQFITHRYVQGALGLDTFVGNIMGYGVGVGIGLAFLGKVFATKVNQMPNFEGVVKGMYKDEMDFMKTYEKLSSLNISDYLVPGNRVEKGLMRQLEPERLAAYRRAMFDLARAANYSLNSVSIPNYADAKAHLALLEKSNPSVKFSNALAIFNFADSILKRLHELGEMEDTAENSELERMLAIDICILKSLVESGDFANIRPYLVGVAQQIKPIMDALPSLRSAIRAKFIATDLDAGTLGDVVPDEIFPEEDDYPIDLDILRELR